MQTHTRMNLTTSADLVSEFNGDTSDFETWEKQIKFIKNAYSLEDDAAKILIGTKLKKKALEWFHSKSEYLGMTFNEILLELKGMVPSSSK